jgi:hypothetical protein
VTGLIYAAAQIGKFVCMLATLHISITASAEPLAAQQELHVPPKSLKSSQLLMHTKRKSTTSANRKSESPRLFV